MNSYTVLMTFVLQDSYVIKFGNEVVYGIIAASDSEAIDFTLANSSNVRDLIRQGYRLESASAKVDQHPINYDVDAQFLSTSDGKGLLSFRTDRLSREDLATLRKFSKDFLEETPF